MRAIDRYDSLIRYYAELQGFTGTDWLRFKAQIRQESNFQPDAVSPVGARGLSQFMPPTWKEWQDGTPGLQEIASTIALIDPRDPEDAIRTQVAYMKWLLRRLTSWERAFAGYNWGIGNVLKLDARTNTHGEWIAGLPEETANYLSNIAKFYEEYRKAGQQG